MIALFPITVLVDVKYTTIAGVNLDIAFAIGGLYLDAVDDVAVLVFEFDLLHCTGNLRERALSAR